VTMRPPMRQRRLRVVFFGTPSFAVPTLSALIDEPAIEVCLVVTRPDGLAGRGQRRTRSPVRDRADRSGIETYQPATLRDAASRAPLQDCLPDLFVVAAFGLVFGKKTLAIPRLASVNVHGSLLPAYRGASPIAAAILSGDTDIGASLMVMEPGLDTGPVIDRASTRMLLDATAESLTDVVSLVGAALVERSLIPFADAEIDAEAQDEQRATLTRALCKDDGWIDWNEPAINLERHVRAMWPWPRAWTTMGGEPLQIHKSCLVDADPRGSAGNVDVSTGAFDVATGDGVLRLLTVQPASRGPMSGAAYVAGRGIDPAHGLGAQGAPGKRPPIIVAVTASGGDAPI